MQAPVSLPVEPDACDGYNEEKWKYNTTRGSLPWKTSAGGRKGGFPDLLMTT